MDIAINWQLIGMVLVGLVLAGMYVIPFVRKQWPRSNDEAARWRAVNSHLVEAEIFATESGDSKALANLVAARASLLKVPEGK